MKPNGKLRLIHNLSFPSREDGVNSAISGADLPPVALDSVHRLRAGVARRVDAGAALGDLRISKVDLAAAYRHIPVRPEEVAALGMRGPSGELYFDLRLPFGLASAPAIFTTISSLLRDIAAKHLDIETYVYVDDFGILSSQENAERDVAAFVQLLEVLGVPVSSEKLAEEGRPSQVKTYLGIELDL